MSGTSFLYVGEYLEFGIELSYSGCLYAPGAVVGGSNRVALNINKIDNN
jgi:hypothetical protein